ncbi:hypothetical protein Ancab_002065 [Ancistrocladus abbreviatus]
MMMIGELPPPHPMVQVPPWDQYDDPSANILSPYSPTATNPDYYSSALQRYLPSNEFNSEADSALSDELDLPFDLFSSDNFRMFEFKVRKCARGRSHDWTECPFAHPGEKARRRDPRGYHYSGTACPEFRKGSCKKGDLCEFAHGVFELWLHPARYRTQPCKDGPHCKRRVCFFAHSAEELRVLPSTESVESIPCQLNIDSIVSKGGSVGLSPTSILVSPTMSPSSDSPPMSPSGGASFGCKSVSELVGVMRSLQIGKVSLSPRSSWGVQIGSGFGSPKSPASIRPGLCSLPSTPTRSTTRCGLGYSDSLWETSYEEEPTMERVESGRDIRAKMYAKLSRENSLGVDSVPPGPDVGWVSELVK